MKLTESQTKDIADCLDMGMVCYLHKETGALKCIPNDEMLDMDEEAWEEDLEELEENQESYIMFEAMTSNESFRIMEDFAESIDDPKIKDQLFAILNRKSPFANFKWEVENSKYRQPWFDFKAERQMKWVKDQSDFTDNS